MNLNGNKKINNQNGFGLLEAIMGAVLIAGAAILITKGIFLHKDSDKVSKTIPRIVKVNDSLIGSMKALFKDTKDSDGKRTRGLCQFITTNNLSPGVGQIKLNIFSNNDSNNNFAEEDWSKNFFAWELANEAECEGTHNWRKCFKLKDPDAFGILPTEKDRMNIVGVIEVTPANMNPVKPDIGLFEDYDVSTSGMSVDVKDISFRMVAKVYHTELIAGNPRKTVMQEDFFWAPAIGECDKTLNNGTEAILSLSGMGGADPYGRFIYNKSSFTASQLNPLDVEFVKSQITVGKINPESQRIVSDTNANVAVSCNETTFRCPQDSTARDYGPMNVYFRLEYNENNTQAQNTQVSSMKFEPTLRILKGASPSIVDPGSTKQRVRFSTGNGNIYEFTKSGNQYVADVNGNQRQLRVESSHALHLRLEDQGTPGTNNNLCRNICTPTSNYNYNGAGENSQNYSGVLYYKTDGVAYSHNSLERMECIACYMKDCGRLGLATFGPMHSQPSQPLDAGVPECNAKISGSEVQDIERYDRNNIQNSNQADQCVSARLDEDTDKLILETKSCSTQLPVMCFNFGQFILAKDLNSNNSDDLAQKSFADAAQRCFETGREIANKAQLDSYVTGGPVTAPQNNGSYNFINLAQQGMFIAPQTASDIESYREWLSENSITDNPEFWIALRSNHGHVHAVPPEVKAGNQDQHALYFNANGRLVYNKFTGNHGINTGGTNKGMMLLHHIRHKGVVEANPNQGSTQFSFLCTRANGQLFKSNATSSSFDDGASTCSSEGGLFLPPVTAVGWTKAFALAAPFATRYAFPNPNDGTIGAIWVAYQDDGSGNWKLPTEFYVNHPEYALLDSASATAANSINALKTDGTTDTDADKALCLAGDKFVSIDKTNDCDDGSNKIEMDELRTSPVAKVMYMRWIESGHDGEPKVKVKNVN